MCIKLERSSGLTTVENGEATWETLGWWHTPNLGECRRVASPYFSYFEEVFISGLGVTPQIMHFCCTAGIALGCLMSSSGVSWHLWSVGSKYSYSTMAACDFIFCQFEVCPPLSLAVGLWYGCAWPLATSSVGFQLTSSILLTFKICHLNWPFSKEAPIRSLDQGFLCH